MVRASKTPVAASPAASPAPVSAEPKKVAKKVEGTKAPKASKAAPAPAPVESAPASDVPANEVLPADDLVDLLSSFSTKINELSTFYATLKGQYKLLQKVVLKEHKTAQKVSNRKNKRSGNRKPSGFVRPTMISDELAAFLGKTKGTEMARTEVSKEINNYIRVNKLQDEKNGRQINADAKLSTLLNLPQGDTLTYFNLQRYMKHHFVKPAVATA
jgi:chromatin remodeling complex protein RSC6